MRKVKRNPNNPVYAWRISNRLTMKEAAARLGLTHAAWDGWERGSIPHDTNLPALAELIGIKPDALRRKMSVGQRA